MPDTARARSASAIPLIAWVRERISRFGPGVERKDSVAMSAVPRIVEDDGYAAARRALEGFRSLPDGWDGEGAPRPSKSAIDRAMTVVNHLAVDRVEPAPHVFALPDGGVQLCWNRTTRSGRLEVEARLEDEGGELMIGYAHQAGFEFHEPVSDPYEIVKRVSDQLNTTA